MNDIGLFYENGIFTPKIVDGDLAGDEGLETAVIISLFSDKRISDEEIPDGITDKRGWWGDMFPDIEGDKIGSKLWLVSRGKINAITLANLENYAKDSLQWMIDDGVASYLEVVAAYLSDKKTAVISISIQRPTGETDKFALNWAKQELLRA
jgi:phage gp46-like protein